MSDNVFGPGSEVWKSELDAINDEASSFLAAARRLSVEERRALQSQCAALIERRNAAIGNLALEYSALIERRNTAIRNLLHSAFPRLPSQGIDENSAPEGRKLGVLSNARFKEVVAAARGSVTGASRTIMRALGIKSGRDEGTPGSVRVKQAIAADDSSSSNGPSIQPSRVSVSTTDTVDRSLDAAAIEAWSDPGLNSDLKDELTRVLSGRRR